MAETVEVTDIDDARDSLEKAAALIKGVFDWAEATYTGDDLTTVKEMHGVTGKLARRAATLLAMDPGAVHADDGDGKPSGGG